MNHRTKSLLKLFLFIAALGLISLLIRYSGLRNYLEEERLQTWVRSFGLLGPLIYILVFMIAPAFFLPGLPITVAGGVVFGPVWGTLYASLGSTLGAGLAFLVSRYFAREQIRALLGPKLLAIDRGVEEKGWIYVAMTRLIPLFPYNLLNYAFGLTRIKFYQYLLISWICMFPATAAYVIFSSSLLDLLKGTIPKELIVGVILFILVALLPVIYRKIIQRNPPA